MPRLITNKRAEVSFPGTDVRLPRGKTELSDEDYGRLERHKLFVAMKDSGLLSVEETGPRVKREAPAQQPAAVEASVAVEDKKPRKG